MIWKHGGKRHVAMRRCIREDNIKIDLIAVGFALWA